jgi:hypothetical protein
MYFLTSSPYLEKGKQLDNMKKKKIYNPISFFLLLLLLRLHTQFQEIGDINNKSYHVWLKQNTHKYTTTNTYKCVFSILSTFPKKFPFPFCGGKITLLLGMGYPMDVNIAWPITPFPQYILG